MPKYENLADHYKAKYEGQLARCKEQGEEIASLYETIEKLEKLNNDLRSQVGGATNIIGNLKGRITDLSNQLLDTPTD